MPDLQPVIFTPNQPTVVTVVNDSGSIIVSVPSSAPIIATPVETIVVIDVSTPPAADTIVVELNDQTLVVMPPLAPTVVVMESAEIVVVTPNEGPQGAPGPSSDSLMTGVAGAVLAAYRVVKENNGSFYYVDQAVESDGDQVVGLTVASAALAAAVSVQIGGELQNLGWSWTSGLPVFVTGQGLLSQTAPSTGSWVLQIGVATQATRLFIRPQQPIFL